MIFSLDVRRARKGDCLLLHFGDPQSPGLGIIDGGPRSVFKPQLEPRLQKIREKRLKGDPGPLPVDLLMVSHVDDDHIQGILELTGGEIQRQDAQKPTLVQVLDFWHNSFDALIGEKPEALTRTLKDHAGAAALSGGGISDDAAQAVEEVSSEDPEVVRSALQVLASIEQGYRLRLDAERLGYPPNVEFDGKLVMADAQAIDFGNGLKLTVAGPMHPELEKLREAHQAWLKELQKKGKSPPAALAAYVDRSVPNLSSIVVLAEVEGKSILLTGDARGDKILRGLEAVGRITKNGKMKVNVLKVPHHGSSNNLNHDFFERIVADHYVFSGNGEHGNPERESLEMLFAARKSEPFVIHLTYPVDAIDVEREKDWNKERGKEQTRKKTKPATKVRPEWSAEKNSLKALLASHPLAKGQAIRVVEEGKPHVIDLLDPLGF